MALISCSRLGNTEVQVAVTSIMNEGCLPRPEPDERTRRLIAYIGKEKFH
jgi:hypothetical protein